MFKKSEKYDIPFLIESTFSTYALEFYANLQQKKNPTNSKSVNVQRMILKPQKSYTHTHRAISFHPSSSRD